MDKFSNFFNFILDPNKTVLGLQATSFIMIALVVMSMCCLKDRIIDDKFADGEDGCCILCLSYSVGLLYPIAGKLLNV